MKCLVIFACVVACALAQYPYSHPGAAAGQSYSPQGHNQYAGNPNPGYNSGPQGGPASVHYVNIGAQLQGDYKFGYDTGRGSGSGGQSFREETRLPDGTVKGAYGYVDASGQRRVIKYSAGKDGFVAEGDDVPKTPPAPAPQAPQQYAPQQPAYNPQPSYNVNNDVSGRGGSYYDPNLLNYNIGNNPNQYQG